LRLLWVIVLGSFGSFLYCGISHDAMASTTGAECDGWDVVGDSVEAGGDNSLGGEPFASILLLTCAVLCCGLSCGISHVDEASTMGAECEGCGVVGGCSIAGGDNSLGGGSVVSILFMPSADLGCSISRGISCGLSHVEEASTTDSKEA